MAKYAYVEDNRVVSVFEHIPTSWKTISNFHLLDKSLLKEHGFYEVEVLPHPAYDTNTTVASLPTHSFLDNRVVEHVTLSPKVEAARDLELEWMGVRAERTRKIEEVQWRFERAMRQQRLGLPMTDDPHKIDTYIQALMDIPQRYSDPRDVVWPVLGD